jgi:opacity protein-like surface antigen
MPHPGPRCLALAVATLLLASRAHAQMVEPPISAGDAHVSFLVGAGPAFPVGDLRDAGKNGFAGLLALGLQVPLVRVGLRLEGMYQEFKLQDADAHVSTRSVGLNAVVRVPSTLPGNGLFVRPFVTGGLGYARTREDQGDVAGLGVGRDNGFTWNLGGGIAIPVPYVNLGVEARYVEVRAHGNSLGSVPVFATLTLHR